MIRKWSYIKDTFHAKIDFIPNMQITTKYKFKIFRTTTRFKRYNIGKTKFVRKLNFQLRRQTSQVALTFISTYWFRFFLNSKHIYRFIQNISILKYQLFLPDYKFFLKSTIHSGNHDRKNQTTTNAILLNFLITYVSKSAAKRLYRLNHLIWKTHFLITPYSYLYIYIRQNLEDKARSKSLFKELLKLKTPNLTLLKFENINIFYPVTPLNQNLRHKLLILRLVTSNVRIYRNWVVQLTLKSIVGKDRQLR